MKNLLFCILLAACLASAESCSNSSLPRAEKSISDRFQNAGEKVFTDVFKGPGNILHSLMIVDEGEVAFEKYNVGFTPDQLQVMWSVSKTFTATAVGFAWQDGLVSPQDRIVSYFEDSLLPAETSPYLDSLTIHDLLIMSSGWHDYVYEAIDGTLGDWGKATLSSDYSFRPGDRFSYNSMNAYILSMIITKVTGMKMADYLNEKLFCHLGIEDYHWLESPQGFNAGGWGLYLSTESLAKTGQFFLQKGRWKGKQLLKEEWFDLANHPHIYQYKNVITDETEIKKLRASRDHWSQGYGYQSWNCNDGAVRMHGANGQLCIIFPDKNAVVVATSYCTDEKALLDSIWENIYPLL